MITLEEAMTQGRGVERPFNCPNPDHDDTNASASVNVHKQVWFCYACGAKGKTADVVPTIDQAMSILTGEKPPRVLPEAWLDMYDADHVSPYWAARFGIDVAMANRCGTDVLTGAPTYPIRDPAGRPLGVVTRHNVDPKYKYPYSVSTSKLLYGPLKRAAVVVLLEGAADVMALQQAVLPRSWAAVGCYGAGLHYPQIDLVISMGPAVVIGAFDDDDAGHKALDRARHQLAEVAPVVSDPWSTIGVKDPAEAPPQIRLEPLRRALVDNGFHHLAEEAA
jgi:DNA primase